MNGKGSSMRHSCIGSELFLQPRCHLSEYLRIRVEPHHQPLWLCCEMNKSWFLQLLVFQHLNVNVDAHWNVEPTMLNPTLNFKRRAVVTHRIHQILLRDLLPRRHHRRALLRRWIGRRLGRWSRNNLGNQTNRIPAGLRRLTGLLFLSSLTPKLIGIGEFGSVMRSQQPPLNRTRLLSGWKRCGPILRWLADSGKFATRRQAHERSHECHRCDLSRHWTSSRRMRPRKVFMPREDRHFGWFTSISRHPRNMEQSMIWRTWWRFRWSMMTWRALYLDGTRWLQAWGKTRDKMERSIFSQCDLATGAWPGNLWSRPGRGRQQKLWFPHQVGTRLLGEKAFGEDEKCEQTSHLRQDQRFSTSSTTCRYSWSSTTCMYSRRENAPVLTIASIAMKPKGGEKGKGKSGKSRSPSRTRSLSPGSRQEICNFFAAGTCKRGKDCAFKHVKPPLMGRRKRRRIKRNNNEAGQAVEDQILLRDLRASEVREVGNLHRLRIQQRHVF